MDKMTWFSFPIKLFNSVTQFIYNNRNMYFLLAAKCQRFHVKYITSKKKMNIKSMPVNNNNIHTLMMITLKENYVSLSRNSMSFIWCRLFSLTLSNKHVFIIIYYFITHQKTRRSDTRLSLASKVHDDVLMILLFLFFWVKKNAVKYFLDNCFFVMKLMRILLKKIYKKKNLNCNKNLIYLKMR